MLTERCVSEHVQHKLVHGINAAAAGGQPSAACCNDIKVFDLIAVILHEVQNKLCAVLSLLHDHVVRSRELLIQLEVDLVYQLHILIDSQLCGC